MSFPGPSPAFGQAPVPSAPFSGSSAVGGGLLFATGVSAKQPPPQAPAPPAAPAFFGALGGQFGQPGYGLGGYGVPVPNFAQGPPGPPMSVPMRSGPEPPGPPAGMPPGFPPMGMPPGMPPFMGGMPPQGFPPGFALPQGPPGPAVSSTGPCNFGGYAVPLEFVVKAPPGSPPRGPAAAPAGAAAEASKKRRKGVEGLAPSRNIKGGGAVTVYSGYEGVTLAQKKAPQAAPPEAPPQPTSSGFGVVLPQPGSAVQGTQALQRQLPEGWEMKKSRSTGKVYYINEKLGKSQFDPPQGSTIKAETSKKKQKTSLKSKDLPDDERNTDRATVFGAVRASDQKLGRWQKWQKCNAMLNEPEVDKDD